jgi:hypothetical protein
MYEGEFSWLEKSCADRLRPANPKRIVCCNPQRIADMDPRQYFLALVETAGGLPAAAKSWGIPYPTLAAIANGGRGISKRMAQRIEVGTNGLADPSRLVWVQPTKDQVA